MILSTVLPEVANQPHSAIVHVLHGARTAPPLVDQISKEMKQRGVTVKAGPLDKALDGVATGSRVVVLLDETQLLVNASEQDLKIFQYLTWKAESLVALTSCGVVKGRNADGALIPGLLRVLQNENPASQYMSIDIDANNFEVGSDEGKDLARCIVDHKFALHQGIPMDDEDGNPKDREFSWQDGSMWVSRHVPDAGFHS